MSTSSRKPRRRWRWRRRSCRLHWRSQRRLWRYQEPPLHTPLYFHPSFLPCLLLSFQAEETKVLRLQLELSQHKGELERRLQEKEEEMDAVRSGGGVSGGSLLQETFLRTELGLNVFNFLRLVPDWFLTPNISGGFFCSSISRNNVALPRCRCSQLCASLKSEFSQNPPPHRVCGSGQEEPPEGAGVSAGQPGGGGQGPGRGPEAEEEAGGGHQ